ncbi:MAG TPA: HK97 family phage prohead protease [Tepidisphaeraceae bacterium]|jgi:hypothetical protein|nr:HK97 family phage prohead protease [Tepidisphaeraceae bacterium]
MSNTDKDKRQFFTRDAKFAVAKADGKPVTLSGYALVWNVSSDDRGGYRVRLMPGSATFAKPTLALYHHWTPQILGNTANGTLRIMPDDYGVKVEIDLPDTTTGRDVAELVGKGYVTGMSFSMVTSPDGVTTQENGQSILNASAFVVDEVTITATPAFTASSVEVKPPGDASPKYAARAAQALQLQRFTLDQYRL